MSKNLKLVTKKLIALILVGILALSTLAGCATSKKGDDNEGQSTVTTAPEKEEAQTADNVEDSESNPSAPWIADGKITYPLESEKTITIWSQNNFVGAPATSFEDSPFLQGLEEKLGVNLEWVFPATGVDPNVAFSLLLASGEMPDIVMNYVTSPESYIEDGYFISLNEYKEYAPSLFSYLSENPSIDKAVKTDAGTYYMFPFVRGDEMLRVYQGPAVRRDWLVECGLSMPETIADYDKVARTFKEKYGAVYSAFDGVANLGLASGFNTIRDFYLNNEGKVAYGPVEDNYRNFLTFLNQWYKDGILDLDFATMDRPTLMTKIINNEVGLAPTTSGILSNWINNAAAQGNEEDWTAAPYPVPNKGDKAEFTQMDLYVNGFGARITTACEDIALACAILDYGYSAEGNMYWNYGTEGVSYNMVDGKPIYSDIVTSFEKGVQAGINYYSGTAGAGIAIQDLGVFEQRNLPVSVEAVGIWLNNSNMNSHLFGNLTASQAEANMTTTIESNISAYVIQMYFEFIMGQTELNDDTWTEYVNTIQKMGLDSALNIKQIQVDRLNNR